MKKTFNINVAGFPFVIDEDAYTLLDDYLKTIEHAFKHVDGSAELINDIESRVAELLLACTEEGSRIISLADVEQVIARVGKPEEFVEEDILDIETENGDSQTIEIESQTTTPPPYIPNPPKSLKRLYRDPQNAMLGGVCSGLAWYLGWDVTWVRLLIVALTIFSYSVIGIVYIVLWIVVPEARTPLQRMQMMGEQPTMENIGKTVTDNFKEEQGEHVNPQTTSAPPAASFAANAFSVLAKIMIIIGLVIAIPILVALGVSLLACVLFLITWGSTLLFGHGLPFDEPEFQDQFISNIVFWSVLCGIGWILTLGIPLLYLIRRGLRMSPFSSQTKKIINFCWGIGFILAGMSTGMVISSAYHQERYEHEQWERHRYENMNIDEADESVTIIETESDSINDSTSINQTTTENDSINDNTIIAQTTVESDSMTSIFRVP